jgi:hypothetical protein
VAAVAIGLGSAEHVSGDDRTAVVISACFAVTAVAAWRLTRRELSAPTLLMFLGLGQLLTHLVMSSAVPHRPMAAGHAWVDVLAHVAAVVLSALALRAGEAGTWAARRILAARQRLRRCLALLSAVGVTVLETTMLALSEDAGTRRRDVILSWMGRRAPPALPVTA